MKGPLAVTWSALFLDNADLFRPVQEITRVFLSSR
jgi:hypothetical protein